jgi:hypothetical protein
MRDKLAGFLSHLAGGLFGAGIMLLLDGAEYGDQPKFISKGQPLFEWYYYFPAFLCTACAAGLNVVEPHQLNISGLYSSSDLVNKIRVWVFACISGSFLGIGWASWIAGNNYPSDVIAPWPGIALVLCTLCITFAGIVYFVGHGNNRANTAVL